MARGARKSLFINTILNRVQMVDGRKSVEVDLSDYNISYVISLMGKEDKSNGYEWVPFQFRQNKLKIYYEYLPEINHIVLIDYMEHIK